MTWTPDTWDAFAALLAGWWPGDFSEESGDAWRLALDGVDPREAIRALTGLLHEGRRFRPSASELLAALRADPSQPTFDEAYPVIYRAASKGFVSAGTHPLVAAFVERQGLERLGRLPLDDPDWGEKHRRDLRDSWTLHCDALEGREIATIALGTGGDLRQIDPARALGVGNVAR